MAKRKATSRKSKLADLPAKADPAGGIIANGMEILGIGWGGPSSGVMANKQVAVDPKINQQTPADWNE